MKVCVLQASSQKAKNPTLEACVREAVPSGWQVVNLGVYAESGAALTYVQAALCVSLLLESRAVDFVITGCSSGQGMALACNSFPGVFCGYVQHPTDAYLFGRINSGNAASYPLGMGWGWAGEINFRETVRALFCEPLGSGYPAGEAPRKLRDTALLKEANAQCKRPLKEVLSQLSPELLGPALSYAPVFDYIQAHGQDGELLALLRRLREQGA